MTETKVSDKAAQAKKASTDAQAREKGPLEIRDDVEVTPTASELAADGDKNKVLGDNPERQFQNAMLTADQQAVANGDDPVHEPAEIEGDRQPKIGDRVMYHSANPIGGQTINPGLIIGFAPSGNANIRLEFIDGSRANPAGNEFGGVPFGTAQEERGAFWDYPEEQGDEPSSKK